MTRHFLSVIFLLIGSLTILSAQADLATPKSELHFCSVTEKSPWLDAYQRGEIAAVRSMDTIVLPLRIHIVGNSQGEGYMNLDNLFDGLKLMNEDFATANVVFYIDGEIDFINNTNYYNHTFQVGAQMMAFNNDNNVVNNYFVGSPAGACGYYTSGQDAIALANNCVSGDDHTWGHEMGHFFTLPHTFFGWEFPDPQLPLPTTSPAPTTVGGVPVERVDGSNCSNSADGFCDTPPDYLPFRWGCNSSGIYPDSLIDPTGEKFVVPAYPIMGYAFDNCVESFTDEQRTAMVTNINARGNLARNIPIEYDMADVTTMELVSPPSGGNLEVFDEYSVTLEWTEADNADFYILQVATNQFFAAAVNYFIYDENVTEFTLNEIQHDLVLNQRYYWRVRPVNRFNVMGSATDGWNFRVTEILSSAIDQELNAAISVFPNPATAGTNSIRVSAAGLVSNDAVQVEMINTNGQVVNNQAGLSVVNGRLLHDISVANVPSGIYFLRIRQADRLVTRRVVVSAN